MGYIVREEHLQTAIEKATDEEAVHLRGCLSLVTELDMLERTVPERLQKARTDAGIEPEELSKAAREWVALSNDAIGEVDRLLTRRCRRADSAHAAVREILQIAKQDLRSANMLDDGTDDGDPAQPIFSELYWKKRALVDSLREFLAGESVQI